MGIPLGKRARDAVDSLKTVADKTSNSIITVACIAIIALVVAVVALIRSK